MPSNMKKMPQEPVKNTKKIYFIKWAFNCWFFQDKTVVQICFRFKLTPLCHRLDL